MNMLKTIRELIKILPVKDYNVLQKLLDNRKYEEAMELIEAINISSNPVYKDLDEVKFVQLYTLLSNFLKESNIDEFINDYE